MFDIPPETPWLWYWLGIAGFLGLLIGFLLGRIGTGGDGEAGALLASELDEARGARSRAEEAAAEAHSRAEGLQQELDDTRTSLADAEREIERTRAGLEAAETRIAHLETEAAVAPAEGDAEHLRAELRAAEERAEGLEAALTAASADADARIAALEVELQGERASRDRLAEELAAARNGPEAPDGSEEQAATIERLRDRLAEAEEQLAAAARTEQARRAEQAEAAETIDRLQQRLAEAEEQLAAAAPSEGDAAREHVIHQLQSRVAALTDVEDRLRAREAELGELRRTQAAVLAAKDNEIRGLRERLEARESAEAAVPRPDPAAVAELAATRSELAAAQERADHWEREAAALRSRLAEAAAPATPAETQIASAEEDPRFESDAEGPAAEDGRDGGHPSEAPGVLEPLLAELRDALADKEARIAYLADRVARLESRFENRSQPPAAAAAVPPERDAGVEDAPPSPSSGPDDLTAIWGIGPAIERKLNQVGITTYDQVARLGSVEMELIGELLGSFLDRIEADDWRGQARTLVEARGGSVSDRPLEPLRPPPPVDDLKQINGIGPSIESTLHGLGITSLEQIAAWTPADVEEIGEALVIFQGRIERERWVEQARRLIGAR